MLPWLLRPKRLSFFLLSYILALSFSETLLKAFLIPIHANVTRDALDRFSNEQIQPWEKKQMVKGCDAADMVEGGLPVIRGPYEERFHFDNDFSFQQVATNFIDVAEVIDTNLAKPEKDPWEFGKAMHAIEDLYSHSNYVVLYREYAATKGTQLVGSMPTFEEVMLQPNLYKDFVSILEAKLRTGQYPTPKEHKKAQETDHGGLLFDQGMNKDHPLRHFYADARQTAVRAVAWYLRLYLKDPVTLSQWKQLESIRFGAGLK